jgi:hypothetical protein
MTSGAKNADYRGGVTCLYDTQLPGACLHAFESGGRSRPGAVRGCQTCQSPSPATGSPDGSGPHAERGVGCRLGQPGIYQQGGMGAFAARFGSITPVLGVGTSQYRGY